MYEVVVEKEISAAHQLIGYQGKCENFHGHNWRIRLEVCTSHLNPIGLAIDFIQLKKVLEDIVQTYDHQMLNQLPDFTHQNPTSENLARIIYQRCQEKLQSFPVQIRAVTVWESPNSFVRYYE